jgi:hypothetical protein
MSFFYNLYCNVIMSYLSIHLLIIGIVKHDKNKLRLLLNTNFRYGLNIYI